MSSRAKLFSREHALEFAIVCFIAFGLSCWAAISRDVNRVAPAVVVVAEILFIGRTTRHAWRQFATFEQTQWSLAVGETSRALLALDYVAVVLWRATYHAAAWVAPLTTGNDRFSFHRLASAFALTFVSTFVPRALFASWRHLAGSRVVPRSMRVSLNAPRSAWWRLPAQIGVVGILASGLVGVYILSFRAPSIWWLLTPFAGLVVYVLVRTSEPFDTDTEVVLAMPRWRVRSGRLTARLPGELAALVWSGTKPWVRWVYLPSLAAGWWVITREAPNSRELDMPTTWLIAIAASLAAVLVGVVASSHRSLPMRLALLAVFAAFVEIVFTHGLVGVWEGFLVRWWHAPFGSSSAGCIAALIVAIASVLAATASPYQWESRGASSEMLRVAGVELERLRRIELLTGFVLGAIAWCALAATFERGPGILLGAAAAGLCLLMQDRTRHAIGRLVVEPRARLHGVVAYALLFVLVVAPAACTKRDSASAAPLSTVLAFFVAALALWVVAWRRAGSTSS